MAQDDYADVSSVEALLQKKYDALVRELSTKAHYTVDLFRSKARMGTINALGSQSSYELYDNPNVGAGTARDGFREPGSPIYGALNWHPVGMHISGGIDGDTWDNLKNAGRKLGDEVNKRIASDFESLWCNLNWNLFHGASGERAVVDVTSYAITASGGISTVQFDDEWGVRHLKVGGTYQFYTVSTNTLKGTVNGYVIQSKQPRNKKALFIGDLTAATLGASALADADIAVNVGCYYKEMDGIPEFLGDSGEYAGGDRDAQYLYQGNQVSGGNAVIQINTIERCDTVMRYIGDGKYSAKNRIDIATPTMESQLMSIGWAQRVFQTAEVLELGYRAVRYKDRSLVIDKDCSWKEWLMLDMSTFDTDMMREFALFQNRNASGIFETRSANGTIMDLYHWVIFGKGQRKCTASRFNLLLHSVAKGTHEIGHLN
jgi:hypothetical protein